MAPIRVGIIGLSASPGAWANAAHLPYLASSPKYQIVAICNSSISAAQAAIKAHSLPAGTKTYANPAELASDPDIDLFVVSTRVDTHYGLAKPALEAGKNIFVEWPLGANVSQATELLSLAKAKNVRTIVGLQGRYDAAVLRVREVISSGRLGTVHSINVHAAVGVWQDNAVGERYRYLIDKAVGGNLLTIYGGHELDTFFFVHGEPMPGSVKTTLANLRPEINIKKDNGTISKETYKKTTPDQMVVQARLTPPPGSDTSPVFCYHLRAGAPSSLTWRIYGTRAEATLTNAGGTPHYGRPTAISIRDGVSGEEDKAEPDITLDGLGVPANNVGRLYEAYAAGATPGVDYADFETAVKRHELIDAMYDGGM